MCDQPSKGHDLKRNSWFPPKKLVGWKGTDSEKLDKTKKKDFTENTLEEEGTQAFASGTKGDKCTWESKDISLSRSSISTFVRFWRKIKS